MSCRLRNKLRLGENRSYSPPILASSLPNFQASILPYLLDEDEEADEDEDFFPLRNDLVQER